MNKTVKNIRRIALALAAMAVACVSQAGTFKEVVSEKIPEGHKLYMYEGEIKDVDVPAYEKLIKQDEHITIVINSLGGNFIAGVDLGRMTMKYRDEVTLVVDKAYSAAATWALGDDDMAWLNEKSELGLHMPFLVGQDAGAGLDQNLGYIFGRYLEDVFGEETGPKILMRLGEIRSQYGKFAMLVMRNGKDPYVKK